MATIIGSLRFIVANKSGLTWAYCRLPVVRSGAQRFRARIYGRSDWQLFELWSSRTVAPDKVRCKINPDPGSSHDAKRPLCNFKIPTVCHCFFGPRAIFDLSEFFWQAAKKVLAKIWRESGKSDFSKVLSGFTSSGILEVRSSAAARSEETLDSALQARNIISCI